MSQLITLNEQLAAARVALTAALGNGEDTTEPRYRIAELENEIAAVERQAREERAAASRAEAAAVEQAGATLAAETHAALDEAANVPGLAELTGEALPAVPEDQAIAAAAREVARCRAHLERAGVDLKPHQGQADKLTARLAEKNSAIDVIKRRRLAGDERDGDAAQLLALTSDAESLAPMVEEARQKVIAADARPAARAALANAEAALAHQQRLTTLAAAKARAELAERVFLDAATKARAAEKAVGTVNPAFCYAASGDLRKLVVGVR